MNNPAAIRRQLIDKKEIRTIALDYFNVIYLKENGDVIIPYIDNKSNTPYIPGADIIKLVKPKHKIIFYGIDNSRNYNELVLGGMKKHFKDTLKQLEIAKKLQEKISHGRLSTISVAPESICKRFR